MKRGSLWAWLWVGLAILYFALPLVGTFIFSLRAVRDSLTLTAYSNAFAEPRFWYTFGFSTLMAVLTIITSLLLMVPTVYWVHLRLPRLRPLVELTTLLPFVVPPVVLVFGLIRIYSRPPLMLTRTTFTTDILLVAGYMVIVLPYIYRAIDTGLRAIDARTLTEAAQSLGAGWPTIMFQVIFPNIRAALLSAAFLTFAIVIGELVLATYLARPAFSPYMALLGLERPYEASALVIVSLILTWAAISLFYWLNKPVLR